MTNKSLRGEDEIATRGVKSYTMAPVRARKRVPYNFYTRHFTPVLLSP